MFKIFDIFKKKEEYNLAHVYIHTSNAYIGSISEFKVELFDSKKEMSFGVIIFECRETSKRELTPDKIFLKNPDSYQAILKKAKIKEDALIEALAACELKVLVR